MKKEHGAEESNSASFDSNYAQEKKIEWPLREKKLKKNYQGEKALHFVKFMALTQGGFTEIFD